MNATMVAISAPVDQDGMNRHQLSAVGAPWYSCVNARALAAGAVAVGSRGRQPALANSDVAFRSAVSEVHADATPGRATTPVDPRRSDSRPLPSMRVITSPIRAGRPGPVNVASNHLDAIEIQVTCAEMTPGPISTTTGDTG